MKKYRVDVIAVQGKGKNVFYSTQVVDEDKFIEGSIEGLVKGGYISEVKGNNIITDPERVKEFEALKAEYLEISGGKSVNGRWGIPKLKEEIDKLKLSRARDDYKTVVGEKASDDLSLEDLQNEIEKFSQ